MEPVRISFWNVPEWMIPINYTIQFLCVAILLGRLYSRFLLWQKGQGKLEFDHFGGRVMRVLKYALAQIKIAREKFAGSMHLAIFFAFVVLALGTALATIDTDLYEMILKSKLLRGDFYVIYKLTLDLFTVIAFFGLGLAITRRYFQKPAKLTYSAGFDAMLWLFFLFITTGLLLESLRLAVMQPEWQVWSFAGYSVSRLWLALNIPEATLRLAHQILWGTHAGMVALWYAVFLDLPTKHIVYSPINIFFSSFREAGALRPLNLDDDTVERFGVSQLIDFHPMQLMDGDACTECGRCQQVCPAHMAGTPLNPKQVILDIQRGLNQYGNDLLYAPSDKLGEMPVLTGEDALWACTTCRACVYECPVTIEHVDAIVDMRRSLVLNDASMPTQLQAAMTNAERAGDPWGNQKGSRMTWAQGLSVPLMAEKKKADVLYWLGCAGAYDPNGQKTARAMVKIFEAAGIDYAVLGEEERCNCEWARRAGNEYLFQEASHSNIAVFDKYEFKVIVTHCPHCFNTFKNEYPQFGGDYDVIHHSVYVSGLIKDGHLKISKSMARQITYHDSCYLGRYNEVYDDPRDALRAIQGVQLIEMTRSREKGLCCGGGGAQVWFETHQTTPVNQIRLEEAISTGAETVSTACPFCNIMLGSAAQSKGVTDQVDIRDVAVIVADALG